MKASCLWPSECQVSCQGQNLLSSSCRDTRYYRLLWLMGGPRNVQVLAMRQLDRNGLQGYQESLVEVLLQSLSYHRHLINLIGYCADNNRRFLFYVCAPSAILKDSLYGKLLNVLSKLRNTRLVRKL